MRDKAFWIVVFLGYVLFQSQTVLAYTDAEKKRDFDTLERLKGELTEAEKLPGEAGLEKARTIKRQIQTIEKGTDIYSLEPRDVQTHVRETPALKPFLPSYAPSKSTHISVTDTPSGKQIDLFHERTIPVGEDYGVSRDIIQDALQKRSSEAHDTLKVPSVNQELHDPFSQQIVAPSPISREKDIVSSPSSLESNQIRLPWKMSTAKISAEEAAYLEEDLKSKLSQLGYTRAMLKKVTKLSPDQIPQWTSRLHELESQKESILRMMRSMGITPTTKNLSIQEDPAFNTIQSQEHQIKKRLRDLEREEKKAQRLIRHNLKGPNKDPKLVAETGDHLRSLLHDKKLLEASLKDLQKNTTALDLTSSVDEPFIYRQEQPVPPVAALPSKILPAVVPANKPIAAAPSPLSSTPNIPQEDEAPLPAPTEAFWSSGMPSKTELPPPSHKRSSRLNVEEAHQISAQWVSD